MLKKSKFFILLVIVGLIISSCTSNVYFQGLRAADVTIPSEIKTVVVVNRFKPTKENRWKAVVEGIFTGEMIGADREGAENALRSFANTLGLTNRYKVVMANYSLEGNGMGFFPEPIAFQDIEKLCNDFNADAVVAIEAFDSDIGLGAKQEERKYTGDDKKEHTKMVWEAREEVNLTLGWRMYSRKNAAIIDEYKMYSRKVFKSERNTELDAKLSLTNPRNAISTTAMEGGVIYSDRIAPAWITYSRSYYGHQMGYPQLKQAKRMVIANDWDNAILLWKSLLLRGNRKLAGRAAYNIAVAYEIKGDLGASLAWAKKAFEEYHNSMAGNYIYQLNDRIANDQRLKQQYGN